MEYAVALSKAWDELAQLTEEKVHSVRLLGDEYSVDIGKRSVLSLSCNVPAQAFASILILHYLKERITGLPRPGGEWTAFQELVGGQGYYPAFKKRVIDRIVRKYGDDPEAIIEATARLNARRSQLADVAVMIEPFEGVPVLIELWRADEEFGPSADILFDKTIAKIFCTEDIVVLSDFIISNI